MVDPHFCLLKGKETAVIGGNRRRFPHGSVSLALWNLSWLLIGIDFNSSNLVPARVYCSLFVIPFKE